MKILIISSMFPSYQRPDYGTFVHQQALAFKKLGHSVHVLSPRLWMPPFIKYSQERWEKDKVLPPIGEYEGIEVSYLKGISLPRGFDWLRGKLIYFSRRNYIKRLMKKHRFDILYAHALFPSGHIGAIIKNKYNLPLIVTIHGADFEVLLSKSLRYKERILTLLENECDAIGLVSERLKIILQNHTNSKRLLDKSQIIYNGIHTYKELRAKKLSKGKIKILTIGSLIHRKNHRLVLESLAKLSQDNIDFHYYIIGSGWDEEMIRKTVEDLKVGPFVSFLGTFNHKIAMEYLMATDIFVMPSKKEAFGVVYIEAMYFKKITIAAKGEGIGNIISDQENGFLVDPDNEKELYELLKNISANYEAFDDVREKAYQTVWPSMSWKTNAKKYIQIFEEKK